MRTRHAQRAHRMLVPIFTLFCFLAPSWALGSSGDFLRFPTLIESVSSWFQSLFGVGTEISTGVHVSSAKPGRSGGNRFGESGTNFGESGTNFGESGTNFGESGTNFGESGTNFGESGTNLGESGTN